VSSDAGVHAQTLTAADEAIVVRDITKTFPRSGDRLQRQAGHTVLSGITFDVRFGEVFGILGANGAGKTTLLEILATLIEPTSGRASVCGHDIVSAPQRVRSCIGYSGAAAYAFYPRLTGARNLEFFATMHNLSRAAARTRVEVLLDEVGLSGAAQRPVQTYSEGMKQRLSLARALAADPAVLLLDEPTRSLDSDYREAFQRLLRQRVSRDRRAVILVTHNLFEADAVCDRACLLDGGKIAAQGRVADIERRSPGPRSVRRPSHAAPGA
jgi:ABC-type multidrug transport system ATPase subunit